MASIEEFKKILESKLSTLARDLDKLEKKPDDKQIESRPYGRDDEGRGEDLP